MKTRISLTTPALVVAFAAAALFGVILPSPGAVFAADPAFVSGAGVREIPENTPPGVNIGAPISATDGDETGDDALEFGNTLTYKLGGTHAALFSIDPSTGQLITKAPLDAESGGPYSVTVTVDDGENRVTSVTQVVNITVTDVARTEAPLAPAPPTVVSGEDSNLTDEDEVSTTSLKVVWHPPENAGRPTITAYAVEYKKSTDTTFYSGDNPDTDATEAVTRTGTTATITGLEADTSYQVRVRATNSDGEGPSSLVGTGSTNREGNSPPQSNEDAASPERMVIENTPAGENVGSPVTATDLDTTTLTYQLVGPDAELFNFNTRTGQIRTKALLNHEDPRCYDDSNPNDTECLYYVTVIVVDGVGGSDATRVTVDVGDTIEAASAPARPTVRATEKSSTSLDVTWTAPENMGPDIADYDVQYRKGSEPFSDDNCRDTTLDDNCRDIPGSSTTITGLDDDTTYEVRITADNGERVSMWSATGSGRTNRANHQPIFDERPHTGTGSERGSDFTVSRRVDENPRSGQVVGGRVFADDEDNDKLTYSLLASADTDEARAEAAMFDIDETTGQIRTKAGVTYNYEALDASGTCTPLTDTARIGSDRCYTVKVEVRDGLDVNRVEEEKEGDPDDSITVKIGVRDREEPPAVPTVTVTSPLGNTTLVVIWDAKNTGPDITSYDVQYRKGSGSFSEDNCGSTGNDNCNITGSPPATTTTIVDLDQDTSYSVQVRATNDEGVSAWSRVVTVKTNKGDNVPPAFDDAASPVALTVPENTLSSRDVGNAVSATDLISTSLTYKLEGRDAASFSINSSTGQIRTRSALNTEAICSDADADATGGHQENCTYSVRVKVEDRGGGSASKEVTITVSDAEEAPSAPSAPRVTATKDTGWSLDVTWNEPSGKGKPPVTDYDIQYREYKTGTPKDNWLDWPRITDGAGNTDRSAKITRRAPADDADPLKPRTQYEVRVRAKNGEGDTTENWSSVGRGTTGSSNNRPAFDRGDAIIELRVDEDTRSGQNVGSAVSASDTDSNTLTYSLEGPGAASFTIVSSSGQIRTRSPLDFETRQSYSVTVKVDDRQKRNNSVAAKSVTITVDNVTEQPSAPAAPRVSGIPGLTDSVRVTWDAPANTGPAVTAYEVHYREAGAGLGFARWTHSGADRSTIITGLKAGTRYEVQVRVRSAEGTSEWSRSGTGAPNPDVANRNPQFSGGARTLSVAENTALNTDIGSPVAATDRDGDTLTYSLEGADADSFDILSTSDGGQLRTSAALNHEDKSRYSVTVRVTDGRGGTDAANLTINVTDVNSEAPDTPFAPRVTAVSSTRLHVSWEEPDNQGPLITDYDYRYRAAGGSWTEVTGTTVAGTTVTIQGLAASTSYDVEVRATNAEGTSDWSNPGIGSTNAPGANNPPVFSEGVSATRSVSAGAPAGTAIGPPVAATDADSGDTLTYSLEGRDAAFFDIDGATGQLRKRSNVPLIIGETYGVTVLADDGTDTARIAVAITATAAPPNNRPVFSEGTRTTRSVARSARASTAIGQRVGATDADAGDTLTYTLEGTDAASFRINNSTGQLLTRADVTLDRASYTVTVVATDDGAARATIAVTINITNRAPAFGSSSTTRSVARSAIAGTSIGVPVTATDADIGDTLTYTLEGTDAASFRINSSTGQLLTQAALDKNSYTVTVVATDQANESARITVTINVANRAPQFSETSTTQTVDRNALVGTAIGAPVTATDADPGDLLAYRLSGTDAASFRINSSTGQLLTRAGVALDVASYSVTVIATDQAGETASIDVTINVANSAPVFSDATSTRSVERGAPAGTAIGDPVTATDADVGDRLAYSLAGTDRASFRINGSTGQLLTRAGVTLDAASYSVTVVATDELTASASISVTITVANAAPAFTDTSTSRTVGWTATENTPIGNPVTATDSDPGDTLAYSLAGADAASFGIDSSTGQLLTRAGVTLNRASYSITVVATDVLGATASIAVTITIANATPAFSDTTATRTVDRNAAENTTIGNPVTATDSDPGDTLAYSLAGADAASLGIDSSTGQLLTRAGVSFDRASYSITVVATDGLGAAASIAVTITVANAAPAFSDTSTSRTVGWTATENTPIGNPVTATDSDPGDTLTYSLAGADAASFGIDSSTGQLLTRAGVTLNRASYSITVVATDVLGATASIAVTITIANATPAFSDTTATRTVDRNAAENTPIGNPVTATDSDPGDTLAYSLSGADAASLGIDSSTGQLLTRAGVSFDRASYSITVVATDGLGATASIAVTITVANAAPAFSDTTATRTVDRDAAENTPIGNPVTATDSDPGDTLAYSLSGADAASLGIDSSTGQLLTRTGVSFDRASYSITVVATDGLGATASIAVTITVANAAPAFSDTTATRTVDRDASADTNIGAPITAMDADTGDTLTYSLGGDDDASFHIDSSDGQLLTLEGVSLDEDSYAVMVIATDGLGATATISVTITVTDGDGLLGRFDTDEDGSISQDEVFEAILEFLSGQANSDEILGIILLFITQ